MQIEANIITLYTLYIDKCMVFDEQEGNHFFIYSTKK
jgi:hypothetical protein